MRKIIIFILLLWFIAPSCGSQKRGSPVHKMGKVNKKVRKKSNKTHRLGRLRKNKHKRGIRKTHNVPIKQKPVKSKKKEW